MLPRPYRPETTLCGHVNGVICRRTGITVVDEPPYAMAGYFIAASRDIFIDFVPLSRFPFLDELEERLSRHLKTAKGFLTLDVGLLSKLSLVILFLIHL